MSLPNAPHEAFAQHARLRAQGHTSGCSCRPCATLRGELRALAAEPCGKAHKTTDERRRCVRRSCYALTLILAGEV
jgi:hypothetical protein